MFKKRLEYIFVTIIIFAIVVLAKNYYESYSYKHNSISDNYKQLIEDKEEELLELMNQHYGFRFKVPLIVTDKFKGRLYGLTSYKDGEIKIYLNKNVMQESMKYMIESVIAHEYAHALMFKLGHIDVDDGHSKLWQQTCINLGGVNCAQYVDSKDIVMGKMPF